MLTEFIYGFFIDLGATSHYFPTLNDWVLLRRSLFTAR